MKQQQAKSNLTEGSIFKALVKLSIPLILTNILQTAYNLTDTYWVGRLGSTAIAAVSLSFPIIFIIISLGMGLGMAGSILVAQNKGRENQKAVNHIATQTLLSIFFIAVLLSLLGYFISPYLIGIMNIEPKVYTDAVSYLKISFIGLIFMFVFMVFQSLMRSIGEVKLPFYIVLSTVLLNLVLDPLFIFGWKNIMPAYGVKGAAIATISTQLVAAAIGLIIILKGYKGIKVQLSDYKPDWQLLIKMVKLGVPVSIEQLSRSLSIFAMVALVAGFGTLPLASYGIGSRILSFVIIPAFGLGMATSTLVGQNLGAQKHIRVKQTLQLSLKISFGVMSFLGIIFYIFSQDIARFFIPNEVETIRESSIFIKYIAVSFGFIGMAIVSIGGFRGIGKTKLSMLLTLFSVWIIRFPLAYFLSHYTSMAETGIWIAYPVTNIATALVAMLIFLKRKWFVGVKGV